MTEPTMRTPGVKTLGVKIPDELHSQFSLIAQLNELSLNDAVLRAVQEYVDRNKSEADFAEQAAAVVAEIEREAAARRGAIQALFGTSPEASAPAQASEVKSTRRKGGTEA